MLPRTLQQKLDLRKTNNALRNLGKPLDAIDFSSNDYLGFSKSKTIFNASHTILAEQNMLHNGATGSRLLSGNHNLYEVIEKKLAKYHNSDAALVFNSGYDANIGFFSAVPQRGDVILYDEYIHASIRDGITMSHAKAYKFKHNDIDAIESLLKRYSNIILQSHHVYIVTESVFSMDGDSPDLKALIELAKTYHAFVIVDEAHAVGVCGDGGVGLVQDLELEAHIFARIVTFGKAIGCHGAAILSSKDLKQYLVNFCRSLIYTTALPPHSLASIAAAYQELASTKARLHLLDNIKYFKTKLSKTRLHKIFIPSDSAIQCCIISGNTTVKAIARELQQLGFDIKAILSPTVPEGEERLRFCIHAYNSKYEITSALETLAKLAAL